MRFGQIKTKFAKCQGLVLTRRLFNCSLSFNGLFVSVPSSCQTCKPVCVRLFVNFFPPPILSLFAIVCVCACVYVRVCVCVCLFLNVGSTTLKNVKKHVGFRQRLEIVCYVSSSPRLMALATCEYFTSLFLEGIENSERGCDNGVGSGCWHTCVHLPTWCIHVGDCSADTGDGDTRIAVLSVVLTPRHWSVGRSMGWLVGWSVRMTWTTATTKTATRTTTTTMTTTATTTAATPTVTRLNGRETDTCSVVT